MKTLYDKMAELAVKYVEDEKDYTDPVIIRWLDTGELEVVPAPHLTDVSWSERGREREVLAYLKDIPEYFDAIDALEGRNVCGYCGYKWTSRIPKPVSCPRCKRRIDY